MSRVSKSDRIKLWLDRLTRFRASNQTVAQFCTVENISAPAFYAWKRRLSPSVTSPKRNRKPQKSQRVKPEHASAFAELTMTPVSPSTASVRLPGGIEIELGSEPDASTRIIQQVLAHSLTTTSPAITRNGEAGRC